MLKSLFVLATVAVPLLTLSTAVGAADDEVMIGKDKLWNAPRPDLPDLSVQFIARTPRYPGYEVKYTNIDDPTAGVGESNPITIVNADAQHAPKPGETVTYTATVRNVGTQPITHFDWHWLYDGEDVTSGQFASTLGPDDTTTFTCRRPWEDGRHFIAFETDRERLLTEACEENNWVIDRTDAMAYAFFVEQSVRDEFKTLRNGLGSYDWADWAQFQIRQCNKEFRDTIYPSCPGGIEERVRLDAVYVIPDGWGAREGMHTPNVITPVNYDDPELVSANDPPADRPSVNFNNVTGGVDGVWGFTVDLLKKNDQGLDFYHNMHRWVTGSEWPLHHELGHQLGRNDNYLIVARGKANQAVPGLGYTPPSDYCDGMMHHGNYSHDNAIGKNTQKWDSTYRFYSEHTARSFNRDKGQRRGYFGEYLLDVPAATTFTFVDADAKPIPDAKIELFVGRGEGYTGCGFNAEPNFTGETDAAGRWHLDQSPWKHVFIWGNNGVLMFRVTPPDGKPRIGFRHVGHFNLEYWRGHTKEAEITVPVTDVAKQAAK